MAALCAAVLTNFWSSLILQNLLLCSFAFGSSPFSTVYPPAVTALLLLLRRTAQVDAGAFAALASMLEWDALLVTQSGMSWVRVDQSLPEGDKLGPFSFNLLHDTLVADLVEAGQRVARDASVPYSWVEHMDGRRDALFAMLPRNRWYSPAGWCSAVEHCLEFVPRPRSLCGPGLGLV